MFISVCPGTGSSEYPTGMCYNDITQPKRNFTEANKYCEREGLGNLMAVREKVLHDGLVGLHPDYYES